MFPFLVSLGTSDPFDPVVNYTVLSFLRIYALSFEVRVCSICILSAYAMESKPSSFATALTLTWLWPHVLVDQYILNYDKYSILIATISGPCRSKEIVLFMTGNLMKITSHLVVLR